jgi:outer membrane protein TolC
MSPTMLRAVTLTAALLPALAVAEPLSLDQALTLAVQRSEAARARRAAATSANETARAAGQLPDPMLRAAIENVPVTGAERLRTGSESMTMKRIGISQEWLPADKRAARESAAQAMVEREAVQTGMAEAEVRLQVALAHLDAWVAEAALALNTQTEHHLHEELEAARARLAAALGGSAEVLQLAAAKGLAEDESEEARQQHSAALLALERWVGFKPDAVAPAAAPAVPAEPDYVARHPSVTGLRRDLEVARRSAAAAAAERTPNWTWEVAYGQRSGFPDLVSVGVSIPLQVAPARRQDRETAAKLALVDQAEAELSEAVRSATAEYRALASDADRLQRRIERYRDAVVTTARQRTAAALAAYRSNQGSLAALFESRHMELDAQRRLLDLRRDLARVQARMAFKPLPEGAAP